MQVSSNSPEHTTHTETAHRHGHVPTSTRIRKMVSIALGVSLLLQTVSIIIPGWQIGSGENYSYQFGLFYFVHCEGNSESKSCVTKSFSDFYFDLIEKENKRDKISLERDYTLDIVHSQVGVMVAWLCTLISTIVLLKIYRKREPVPKTLSVLSSSMAVAGIIMGEVIYVYLVKIDAKVRIARLANRSSVGFPYSLFFYIPACIVILLSDAMLFKCLHNDITTLSHVKADIGLYDDITTFSHTRADTGPSDDITTPNDARADTGPSDNITTLNHARADTGPDSYLIPLSQARLDTGRDKYMTPLSQARADTSPYNYINPLSQAGADTGTYSYVTPLSQARPDTGPSAMLELPQIPTTT